MKNYDSKEKNQQSQQKPFNQPNQKPGEQLKNQGQQQRSPGDRKERK